MPDVGTKENPFPGGSPLEFGDWTGLSVTQLSEVSAKEVKKGNPYNDPPQAGRKYVKFHVSATYQGTDSSGSPSSLEYSLSLAGDNAKVYDSASLSDVDGVLDLLDDKEDVLAGGSVSGWIYVEVDVDDKNLMVVHTTTDGVQYVRIG